MGIYDGSGKLIGMKAVTEDKDVIMITNEGIIVRTPVDSISIISRNTSGVKCMNLKEGTEIACVCIAEKYTEEADGNISGDEEGNANETGTQGEE